MDLQLTNKKTAVIALARGLAEMTAGAEVTSRMEWQVYKKD